jgi:hypothetical protein
MALGAPRLVLVHQFAHCGKQLCHTLKFSSYGSSLRAAYPAYWQEIACLRDSGFLIARTELRATTGKRTVRVS